jgi:non-specific serine/threonine protein kinase
MVQAKRISTTANSRASAILPKPSALRQRLTNFKGVPDTDLPVPLKADLRPYQKDGFDFLCHLATIKLGGILADDMGLGKTLQTLAWLLWLKDRNGRIQAGRSSSAPRPSSTTGGVKRRSSPRDARARLESGAARHNLRKQIPKHDIVVTNYALLRRDLEELQKFVPAR